MLCIECKKADTKVIDSRDDEKSIRRRRECLKCGFRFTTYEKPETPNIRIEKRNGRYETYDRNKLEVGIRKALKKRPIKEEEVLEIINDIEHEIIMMAQKIIPSVIVGEIASKKLRIVDDVAYLRFVSVYKSFSTAKSFESEAKKLVLNKERKIIKEK